MTEDLVRLGRIASMAFDRSQAAYAAICLRETAMKQQIDALVSARHNRAKKVDGEIDTALVAGADSRWLAWIEVRLTALNSELAQLRARRLAAREVLRVDFGRKLALETLVADAVKSRDQQSARRRSYES